MSIGTPSHKPVASANRLLGALCKAFGMEGERIRSLELKMSVQSVPTLTVERYVNADECETIVKALSDEDE